MKKLVIFIILSLTFSTSLLFSNTSFAEGSEQFKPGDVNFDGRITSTDLALVVRHILCINDANSTIPLPPTGDYFKAADVDGNGIINSMDMAYIQRYILGMIKTFPVE